jgi:drug/metabolite transporter (DMT)-like permease
MTQTQSGAASRPSRAKVILAFAAIYIIWGSTFLGIRYAIETLPPFLMAGARFSLAGAGMFAWAKFKRDKGGWSWPQWRRAFLIGALLLLCGNGGVTWAEKYIASGLVALLVATEPLWVVVLNWVITRRRPNAKVLCGVLVGLVGVGLLIGAGGLNNRAEVSWLSLAGAGVVVLAGVAWAGGSVYANYRPIKATTSLTAGMEMLSGGSLLLLLGLIVGDFGRLNLARVSWVSIVAFAYLVIFGALGFTAYSYLLQNVSTARAATYAYVNPAVAVFLGWLVANEPLTMRMLIAASVIVGSVALITTYGGEHATSSTDELHDSGCSTYPCT